MMWVQKILPTIINLKKDLLVEDQLPAFSILVGGFLIHDGFGQVKVGPSFFLTWSWGTGAGGGEEGYIFPGSVARFPILLHHGMDGQDTHD